MLDEDGEEEVPRNIHEWSDLQIAVSIMRQIEHSYDNGGHSERSERAQVLEIGLRVCSKEVKRAAERKGIEQWLMEDEVTKRCAHPYQLDLYTALKDLSTETFLCIVIQRVCHLISDDPDPPVGFVEERLVALLARLMRSQERAVFPELSSWDIVREGRYRVTHTAEFYWGIDPDPA